MIILNFKGDIGCKISLFAYKCVLCSVWKQPPYNDKNALIFLSPKSLNSLNYQAILALSTLNTMTEVRPLSKAPNPQLLPGAAA